MSILRYLRSDSSQTLLEAINELRVAEGAGNDAAEYISPELRSDIELHDVIHTVFACPTNLKGEILAHLWSVFGTTLTMREMHRVTSHYDHKTVLKKIGHFRLLKTWLSNFPNMVRVLSRSRQMNRKWPAHEFEQCLNVSLLDLRSEYGIKIIETSTTNQTSHGAALRSIRSQ